MTLSLVTDGMLCVKRCIIRDPRAPEGGTGEIGLAPVPPCAPDAGIPTLTPPVIPAQIQAVGPSIPSIPCAASAIDPTITPPKVPVGIEGSEDLGSETPATPKCPGAEEIP